MTGDETDAGYILALVRHYPQLANDFVDFSYLYSVEALKRLIESVVVLVQIIAGDPCRL